MIGTHIGRLALATTVATIVAFGLRPGDVARADPILVEARAASLRAHAANADVALAGLETVITGALDEVRRGSALVVSGADPPSTPLGAAAASLDAAHSTASRAADALGSLAGTAAGCRATTPVIPPIVTPGDLTGAASALRAAGARGDLLAAQRHEANAALAELDRALTAIGSGAHADASAIADDARTRLGRLDEPEEEAAPALMVWLGTARPLADSIGELAAVLHGGDRAAAVATAERLGPLAAQARAADSALRVHLAEAAGDVGAAASTPLATMATRVEHARGAVASILHPPALACLESEQS